MRRFLLPVLLSLLTLPVLADDLTIGWISRLPELDYVWGSSNPKVDGWPLVGSHVTWRAHVRRWLPTPKTVTYIWRVDDVELSRGTKTLAPSAAFLVCRRLQSRSAECVLRRSGRAARARTRALARRRLRVGCASRSVGVHWSM